MLAAVAGVLTGLSLSVLDAALAVLGGIAAAAVVLLVLGWSMLWPMDAEETQTHLDREVMPLWLDELVIVGFALSGLGVVGGLLSDSNTRSAAGAALLGLVGVFGAWGAVHLMYAVRYAALYYGSEPAGGIDFNSDDPPGFRDFFYFSYNLGMTYQVSDTSVGSREIRAVTLRHCLLSWLFGVAILATAINVVASIFTG